MSTLILCTLDIYIIITVLMQAQSTNIHMNVTVQWFWSNGHLKQCDITCFIDSLEYWNKKSVQGIACLVEHIQHQIGAGII